MNRSDKKLVSMRIDFIQKIEKFDEKTGIFEARIEPDPERYEWKKIKDDLYLYDKLDNALISKRVYYQLFSKISGIPIYYQPNKLGDKRKYFESRKQIIERRLKGNEVIEYKFADKSEEFLSSLKKDKLRFVILSIDIVDSTKLSISLQPEVYTKIISLVLSELSEVIPKFYGYVLKYTGDGLIAYFPEPSFITKNDLALDCSLTLRILVYTCINVIFKNNNLPNIDIRIGIDSGEAFLAIIGSPEAKKHKDIIGSVVNIASKIQSRSDIGGIFLGETVLKSLHTSWRKIIIPVSINDNWEYKKISGEVYKVFKVKFRRLFSNHIVEPTARTVR